MPDNERTPAEQAALTPDELSAEQASDLPDREAMSVFGNFPHGFENIAMPINEATAANMHSDNSIAVADADQIAIIDQGIDARRDV